MKVSTISRTFDLSMVRLPSFVGGWNETRRVLAAPLTRHRPRIAGRRRRCKRNSVVVAIRSEMRAKQDRRALASHPQSARDDEKWCAQRNPQKPCECHIGDHSADPLPFLNERLAGPLKLVNDRELAEVSPLDLLRKWVRYKCFVVCEWFAVQLSNSLDRKNGRLWIDIQLACNISRRHGEPLLEH